MKLFREYLDVGMKGPDVAVLQLILLALGCNKGIDPDGNYGKQTAFGVMDFQIARRLSADGKFGPESRKAMSSQLGRDLDAMDLSLFRAEAEEDKSASEEVPAESITT